MEDYLEIHDLPSPKDGSKSCCWLSIKEFLGYTIIQYHYTHRNGCYIIEYVEVI